MSTQRDSLTVVARDGSSRREVIAVDGELHALLRAGEVLELVGPAARRLRAAFVNDPSDQPFGNWGAPNGTVRIVDPLPNLEALVARCQLEGDVAECTELERLTYVLPEDGDPRALRSLTGLRSLHVLEARRGGAPLDLRDLRAEALTSLEISSERPVVLPRAPGLRELRAERLVEPSQLLDYPALERLWVPDRPWVGLGELRRLESLTSLEIVYTGGEDLAKTPPVAELRICFGEGRHSVLELEALAGHRVERLTLRGHPFNGWSSFCRRLRLPPVIRESRTPMEVRLPTELPRIREISWLPPFGRGRLTCGGSRTWADYPTLERAAVGDWSELGSPEALRSLEVWAAGAAEDLVLFDALEEAHLERVSSDASIDLPNATRASVSFASPPRQLRLGCPRARALALTGLGDLATLEALPSASLTDLCLRARSIASGRGLERYPELRALALSGELRPGVMERVAALPALETLDLTFASFESLAPLAGHPSLRALSLRSVQRCGVDVGSAVRSLGGTTRLSLLVQNERTDVGSLQYALPNAAILFHP